MKSLRHKFERFCFVHRNKGIPNLMLYVSLGSALVYLISMTSGSSVLYDFLCFDRNLILQGQVWRLISYPLAYSGSGSNILFVAISLICYDSLGRAMENVWGTLRFNLFYLSGMVMMDVFAMCLGGITVSIYSFDNIYRSMGYYLNLSLFLGYATLYPNTHFLLFFIIPVKAWIFGVFYLAITAYNVIMMSVPTFFFPFNLIPLVSLANYFLFFGKDIKNMFPLSWRLNAAKLFKKKNTASHAQPHKPIPFPNATAAPAKAPYTHKCTVCGRTDVSHPELEFRYCSRCHGYHCYCLDHISNHEHVTE